MRVYRKTLLTILLFVGLICTCMFLQSWTDKHPLTHDGVVVNMYGGQWGDDAPEYGIVVEYKRWNKGLRRYTFHYFLVEDPDWINYIETLGKGDRFDIRGINGYVAPASILQ